jgi:murein DD-endopeptidase MepM/ murein hydrolase activator NlpD
MPALLALPLTSALWLLGSYGPVAAESDDRLPGGEGAAFRERMMDWSAPLPAPDMPVAVPRTPARRELPRLSSGFGWRVDPILGTRAMHSGIDIPGPLRSPVTAAAGGTVHYAGKAGGYGNMIEIDHGGGLVTRYAHLSRFLVASGARVERGQEIAMMGSTGRSTGSHLHFEVRLNGQATGPLAWLTGEPATERMSPRVSLSQGEPHISAFARARAETESVVGAGR